MTLDDILAQAFHHPPPPYREGFPTPMEDLGRRPYHMSRIPGLLDVLNIVPEAFTPGEDKEDRRFDLLNFAHIPESLSPSVLATMAAAKNEKNAIPGQQNWQTRLPTEPINLEQLFRAWLASGKGMRADPNEYFPGYDSRGWWKGMMEGQPKATWKAISDKNSDDNLRFYFPDYYTTPFSLDFNKRSKYWKQGD